MTGSAKAKVAFVVYSDFECPYCGKFARETLPAIQKEYVESGKVLLAFRQFPLPNHRFAQPAAEAAECAGRSGKFWPFHDRLFADQKALDAGSIEKHARDVGIELTGFGKCLEGQAKGVVEADRAAGELAGVTGTPTFLAGRLLGDGRLKVSDRFSGALRIADFRRVLDRIVASADASAAAR